MKLPASILFTFLTAGVFAQDCTAEALAKKPGMWKTGKPGYVANVTPAELAKEKIVLANIHKMIAASYKPVGVQALYSNAFMGPDVNSGKSWVSGVFSYNTYILMYACDPNSADRSKYYVSTSSATNFSICANIIYSLNNLYAADLPDDDMRGYLKLSHMPQKKDGFYFMGEEVVGDSHLPKKIKEYRWLITYNDTLPFSYVTRKEYLALVKKRLETTIKQNGNSSGYYTPFLNSINDWLKKTDAELSKPAICMWNDEEAFKGFVEEGTKGSFIAVKPNISYYRKKLPRSTPQFFSVVYKVSEGIPVYADNIAAIQKAVDFNTLRNMLGK
jgi:hypothetical protein